MNKHYQSGLDDEHDRIHSDFDEAERFAKALAFVIVFAFLCVVGLWCATASAQTPTFTATRDATVATTFRLAWNYHGAATCVAGDTPGWRGSVPTSGTRTLTGVGTKLNLTLNCRTADTNGSARLDWTPPETYTDGTPITNLGGYRIHYSSENPTLHQTLDLKVPAARSYSLTGLAPGTWYFTLSALTTQCFDTPVPVTCRISAHYSPIASKVVTGALGVALPTLTVELDPFPTPNHPTDLTVTDVPTAFEIKPNSSGVLVATRIGLVPIGTKCESERTQRIGAITYYLVPRQAVDMINWPSNVKLQDVWARCG